MSSLSLSKKKDSRIIESLFEDIKEGLIKIQNNALQVIEIDDNIVPD